MARAFFAGQPRHDTISQLLAELDAEEMEEDALEVAVPWETGGEVNSDQTDAGGKADG